MPEGSASFVMGLTAVATGARAGAWTAVGRRHHVRAHVGGLAVCRDGAGRVLTAGHRLGPGHAPAGPTRVRRAADGRRHAWRERRGCDLPLRPRLPVDRKSTRLN